jgi:hypothetical protein
VVGTMAVLNSFGRAVAMFEAGAIKARPMISHSFKLEDYGQALRMFRAGQGRKLQVHDRSTQSRTADAADLAGAVTFPILDGSAGAEQLPGQGGFQPSLEVLGGPAEAVDEAQVYVGAI